MSDSTRKQTTEEDRDRDGTRREIPGRGGQETEMWAVSASAENWTIDQSRRPTDGRTDADSDATDSFCRERTKDVIAAVAIPGLGRGADDIWFPYFHPE